MKDATRAFGRVGRVVTLTVHSKQCLFYVQCVRVLGALCEYSTSVGFQEMRLCSTLLDTYITETVTVTVQYFEWHLICSDAGQVCAGHG